MTGVPFKRLLGTYPNARLAVEVAFGADLTADPATWVWYDVTTDVMFTGGLVNITPMGRGDETSKAQPAGCKFQLLNTSGAYSKANPVSPYYPNVRRNTPVRARVTLDNVTWYTQFQGFANGFVPAWNTKGNVPTSLCPHRASCANCSRARPRCGRRFTGPPLAHLHCRLPTGPWKTARAPRWRALACRAVPR
jgi:hypothetical protein